MTSCGLRNVPAGVNAWITGSPLDQRPPSLKLGFGKGPSCSPQESIQRCQRKYVRRTPDISPTTPRSTAPFRAAEQKAPATALQLGAPSFWRQHLNPCPPYGTESENSTACKWLAGAAGRRGGRASPVQQHSSAHRSARVSREQPTPPPCHC